MSTFWTKCACADFDLIRIKQEMVKAADDVNSADSQSSQWWTWLQEQTLKSSRDSKSDSSSVSAQIRPPCASPCKPAALKRPRLTYLGFKNKHIWIQKAEDLQHLVCCCFVPSELTLKVAGTVPFDVWLPAVSLLILCALLGVDVILLLLFCVILLGAFPREHLSLHGDVRTVFLGYEEVFDLPGQTAIPQHEDHPVGAHNEPAVRQRHHTSC